MSPTRRAAALALAAALASTPLPALGPEARGDRAFAARGAGFAETGRGNAAAIAEAVRAYEEAVAAAPDDVGLLVKLMDALYFQGYYLTEDRDGQRRIYERLVELAGRAVERVEARAGVTDGATAAERVERLRAVPEAAAAHFWAAAAWGLWGMTHSRLAAVRQGVVTRVRDHAEMTAALDERYEEGGGYRLLGRLHTVAPKVPLLTGWIDRCHGLELLGRALAVSRRDPRNLLFLAEAILEHAPERRDEAVGLLEELARREPDPGEVVEHAEVLAEARRLLAKIR